jgi:hypothetical protein
MNRTTLSIPEIAIIGGTRAALGAGVALLLSDRLNNDQRRAAGWALVAVGVISTVPIAMQIRDSLRASQARGEARNPAQFVEEEQLA